MCGIRISDLQQRLANKATREPEHRFDDLYDLLLWTDVLDEAQRRLLTHAGSDTAGLDGMNRQALRENWGFYRTLVLRQLRDGTFQPIPVRRVYIPKPNGKRRPLGIPTLIDRLVQMAVKIVIEPIFESDFAPYSHGFRPLRSCHTAAAQILNLSNRRGRPYWVIEGDIEGCFDHVHHRKLMTLLRQRIKDKRLLDLIWRFLRAGVMEGNLFVKTDEGTPQGGILSPLLANVYLNHFDQWFRQRAMLNNKTARWRHRKEGRANFSLVRYADDFIVLSNGTKEETVAFKQEIKAWMDRELHLTLSEEKTSVTHLTAGIDFLGFTFKLTEARSTGRTCLLQYPSTESVQRAIRRVSEITDRRTLLKSPADVIDALNAFLRGWGEYFRHCSGKRALRYVGSHAHMRMWAWLQAKSGKQHGWREIRRRYYRDQTWIVDGHRLFILQSMQVEYTRHRAYPNPFLAGHTATLDHGHYDPLRSAWKGHRGYGPEWEAARSTVLRIYRNTCLVCGGPAYDVHHRKDHRPRGGHNIATLVPLCRKHHREAERRNSEVSHLLRDLTPDSGEPDEAKASRPVRGETL
ncbi:MAG TPA: group II intron reverse transcriptase/maturase [Thermomicrobiaceae bacterium]|nr:group II intron reverse transcriptase/maturase [Thermomicrobiaceae bacterium]